MKILIACEESQTVCKAFRNKGHEAFSCDLKDASGGFPEWHIRRDIRDILYLKIWNMIIAFPPCTNLAVSGARYFKEKALNGEMMKSIDFFMLFTDLECPKVCIENPVGIMSSYYRKPDQIIQPYEFGEPESKKTCLWLKGLPLLKPTNILKKPDNGVWNNQTPSGQNKLGPSEKRAEIRSKTYEGIAKAMSDQWSN